jgi:hypothetical protein
MESLITKDVVTKEKKKTTSAIEPTLRKLEKSLTEVEIQKLLYLDLLYQISLRYPARSYSLGSPTSPYFIEGQKVPVKHASLILRMIKNNKVPKVQLQPQNKEQISFFLQTIWQQALSIATSDEKQVSSSLKKKAETFIQVGMQLQSLPPSSTSTDPTLFSSTIVSSQQSGFTTLFTSLWQFASEYCTFSLERI